MRLLIFYVNGLGDIISTGTPPGVGVFRSPPQFLHKGNLSMRERGREREGERERKREKEREREDERERES